MLIEGVDESEKPEAQKAFEVIQKENPKYLDKIFDFMTKTASSAGGKLLAEWLKNYLMNPQQMV